MEFSKTVEGDDRIYLRSMKHILDAFPMKGPPQYCVAVSPDVYIGSQRNADDVDELRRIGITHVLNMAGTRRFDFSRSPYPRNSGIDGYLLIPAEDHEDFNIMRHFPDALNFIEKAKKKKGKTLVHCNLGINRSGSVCAAHLMRHENMSLLHAVQLLKQKRSVVICNRGFRRQLVRYARVLGMLDPITEDMEETARKKEKTPSNSEGTWRSSTLGRPRHKANLTPPEEFLKYRPLPSTQGPQRTTTRDKSDNNSTSGTSANNSTYSTATSSNGRLYSINENNDQSSRDKSHANSISRRHFSNDYSNGGDCRSRDQPKSIIRKRGEGPVTGENHLISWHTPVHTSADRFVSSPHLNKYNSQENGEETEHSSTTRPLRVYNRSASDTLVGYTSRSTPSYNRPDNRTVPSRVNASVQAPPADHRSEEADHSKRSYSRYHDPTKYRTLPSVQSLHSTKVNQYPLNNLHPASTYKSPSPRHHVSSPFLHLDYGSKSKWI